MLYEQAHVADTAAPAMSNESGMAGSDHVISGQLIHMANMGDTQAQALLARIHLSSDPQFRDVDKAQKWLRAAAGNGHAEAQLRLGLLLLTGEGVEKDPEEAARLYCAAGLQGHAEGFSRLAMMFFMGSEIPRDLVSAYAWFSMAALHGKRDALRQLRNLRKLLSPVQRGKGEKLLRKIQGLAKENAAQQPTSPV